MNRIAHTCRQQRGFTLAELSVTIGICATLLGQAVPVLTKMRQERLLRATSEALAGDLRLARSEAARLSDSVYFRVSDQGANACYVMYVGTRDACDCAGGRAACKPGSAVIKAEWLPKAQGLSLKSNAETMAFQYRQGLTTQMGSIDVGLNNGPSIRQVVAITGRVRSCVPTGNLAGLPKCK